MFIKFVNLIRTQGRTNFRIPLTSVKGAIIPRQSIDIQTGLVILRPARKDAEQLLMLFRIKRYDAIQSREVPVCLVLHTFGTLRKSP